MVSEVKPNSLTIMLNVHAIDMTTNIDRMAEVVFSRYLHCKITLTHTHTPHSALWKQFIKSSPHGHLFYTLD